MLKAFLRAPSGVGGMVVLGGLVLVAILGPVFLTERATIYDPVFGNEGPSWAHLLGTDQLGRDIFFRLVVATRLTLSLAVVATAGGAAIGVVFGAFAALVPGRLRSFALRAIDALIAFPALLVAIFVVAIVGEGSLGATLGVAIATSFGFARIASALALLVGGSDYVAAARVLGIRIPRLLLRYVLPNMAETLAITLTVSISAAIVAIASLSFLGLGVQPPAFDWGRMLTTGVEELYVSPAAAIGPAVAIALGALAFGFVGEAIARAMNPVLWARAGGGSASVIAAAAWSPKVVINATAKWAAARADASLRLGLEGDSSSSQTNPSTRSKSVAVELDYYRTGSHGVLEVRNLSVSLPGSAGDIPIVHDVSFTLEPGDMLGIVGESGSGKTMTAMAIAQLLPHPAKVTGTVRFQGEDLHAIPTRDLNRLLGTKLAVVFQDPMTSLNPALRVGRQMTERVEVHEHLSPGSAAALAAQTLGEVHIPVPERQLIKHPHELSGGMRQRVMIAMGLMTEPALLIADEPTTALDVTIQAQIMDVLNDIQREHGATIILISHNLGLVSQNCNRILVMYAGRIVEDLTAEQLAIGPKHPYTTALLASVPDINRPRDTPLQFIPGQMPDIASIPHGCPYHPRCALAVDKCRTTRPLLRLRPDGSRVACHVANQDI